MRRKWEEMFGFTQVQNHLLFGSWYAIDMITGSAKNVRICIVLQ